MGSHALRFANRGLDKKTRSKCKETANHGRHKKSGLQSPKSSKKASYSILELSKEDMPTWNSFVNRQQTILSSIKNENKQNHNYGPCYNATRPWLSSTQIVFPSHRKGDEDVL